MLPAGGIAKGNANWLVVDFLSLQVLVRFQRHSMCLEFDKTKTARPCRGYRQVTVHNFSSLCKQILQLLTVLESFRKLINK